MHRTSSSDSLSESTAHCRRAPAAPPAPPMDESESESESDSDPDPPDSWAQNLDAIGLCVIIVVQYEVFFRGARRGEAGGGAKRFSATMDHIRTLKASKRDTQWKYNIIKIGGRGGGTEN